MLSRKRPLDDRMALQEGYRKLMNTLGMEQREIAGFTDKPMYMGRVEHYYLAGSSRPIEHAELGLQAYHTPSLPGQQPEQSGSFNNCAASAATLLNLIDEEPFIAYDMAKVTIVNVPHWALCPILACYLAELSSL
ncbi:hypothetical protein QQF64_022157 [Cirrhinus molitorella]|uniref:Uncharacterized protein n=1 Tax=Cirrhinus molitorella TaxID=172907 RepID=A0ABR3L7D5_9TELE